MHLHTGRVTVTLAAGWVHQLKQRIVSATDICVRHSSAFVQGRSQRPLAGNLLQEWYKIVKKPSSDGWTHTEQVLADINLRLITFTCVWVQVWEVNPPDCLSRRLWYFTLEWAVDLGYAGTSMWAFVGMWFRACRGILARLPGTILSCEVDVSPACVAVAVVVLAFTLLLTAGLVVLGFRRQRIRAGECSKRVARRRHAWRQWTNSRRHR